METSYEDVIKNFECEYIKLANEVNENYENVKLDAEATIFAFRNYDKDKGYWKREIPLTTTYIWGDKLSCYWDSEDKDIRMNNVFGYDEKLEETSEIIYNNWEIQFALKMLDHLTVAKHKETYKEKKSFFEKQIEWYKVGILNLNTPMETIGTLHLRSELENELDSLNRSEQIDLLSVDIIVIKNAEEIVDHLSEVYDSSLSNKPKTEWWWHLDKVVTNEIKITLKSIYKKSELR